MIRDLCAYSQPTRFNCLFFSFFFGSPHYLQVTLSSMSRWARFPNSLHQCKPSFGVKKNYWAVFTKGTKWKIKHWKGVDGPYCICICISFYGGPVVCNTTKPPQHMETTDTSHNTAKWAQHNKISPMCCDDFVVLCTYWVTVSFPFRCKIYWKESI